MTDAPASGLTATWHGGGGKATCPPNPAFPKGMVVDMTVIGRPVCAIDLPYPAECIGLWIITCAICDLRIAITAAGRPDDPRRLLLPCTIVGQA